MKILILGAAGQIAKILTEDLLNQTNSSMVLFARNAQKRLKIKDDSRQSLIEGDFNNTDKLVEAMQGVELVYVNDMHSLKGTKSIAEALEKSGVKRVIVASILGIYDEVPGAFGQWNERMVGRGGIENHKQTASLIEDPKFDYTILRLTWLYNEPGNRRYLVTQKGEPFEGAQVSREAVSQLIVDIIEEPSDKFIQTSLGVGEPNTNWDKPSFY